MLITHWTVQKSHHIDFLHRGGAFKARDLGFESQAAHPNQHLETNLLLHTQIVFVRPAASSLLSERA
jgi:hypothetical protein